MRRSTVLALCITGVVCVDGDALRGQDAERQNPIVSVYHEPHHRQLFQYGPTRILELQLPPGETSWFHTHESPVLYVTLSTSRTRTQNLGEDWGGAGRGGGPAANPQRGAGPGTPPLGAGPGGPSGPRATSTTSYAKQPVTHRIQNIGDRLFRAMVVLNETPGAEATTEAAAGFDAKPELTNRWFRAYRVVLEPGQKTESHVHRAPVAVFQAIAGKGLGTGAMKWEFNEPGQWAFFDTGDRHEIRNVGDGRLELIEVEVRRP
jgi:quercetin dioxygenase-like cupin family protein